MKKKIVALLAAVAVVATAVPTAQVNFVKAETSEDTVTATQTPTASAVATQTPTATAVVSATATVAPKVTSAAAATVVTGTAGPKNGTVTVIGNVKYKINTKKKTAQVVGVKNKKKASYTVKATIKVKGKDQVVAATSTVSGKAISGVAVTFKVTTVKAKAFKGLKKVKTITIGKNVKTIGAQAFQNDKKLKKIVVKSSKITAFGKKSFKGVSKKAVIKAPKAKVKKYKQLAKKAGFKGKVKK